jgi:hypothetical protein
MEDEINLECCEHYHDFLEEIKPEDNIECSWVNSDIYGDDSLKKLADPFILLGLLEGIRIGVSAEINELNYLYEWLIGKNEKIFDNYEEEDLLFDMKPSDWKSMDKKTKNYFKIFIKNRLLGLKKAFEATIREEL